MTDPVRFGPPMPAVRPAIALLAAPFVVLTGPALVLGLMAAAGSEPAWLPLGLGLLLGVLLCARGWALVRTPRQLAALELGEREVLLPRGDNSPQAVAVGLSAVTAACFLGEGRRRLLVVDTTLGRFHYLASRILEPAVAERAVAELDARARATRAALGLPAAPAEGPEFQLESARRRARATRVLAAVLLALYGAQWAATRYADPKLTQLGAGAPVLVGEGQWFRLFSASVLHGGLLHLYMNVASLLAIGAIVEGLAGTWRLVLVYLGSALGGSLTSTLVARAPLSVGASGAIFGLLGALAVLDLRHRRELPHGLGRDRSWWIGTLAINLLLPVVVPRIDVAAHAGGFVAGALLGWVADSRQRPFRPRAAVGPALRLATVLLATVAFASLLVAAQRAFSPSIDHGFEERRALAGWHGSGPVHKNNLAWEIALHRDPSREQLEYALRLTDAALAAAPRQAAFLDTRATVLDRLGRSREAVELELRALRTGREPVYLLQLARFLDRAGRQAGGGGPEVEWPLYLGTKVRVELGLEVAADEEPEPEPKPEPKPEAALEAGGLALCVSLSRPLPQGVDVFAWIELGGERVGLLALALAPGDPTDLRLELPSGYLSALGHDLRLETALVDGQRRPGRTRVVAVRSFEPGWRERR